MQLTHWNPRQRTLHRNSFLPTLFDDFFSPMVNTGTSSLHQLMPSVDIYEKDDRVYFEAEVPGFNKEDLPVFCIGDIAGIMVHRIATGPSN